MTGKRTQIVNRFCKRKGCETPLRGKQMKFCSNACRSISLAAEKRSLAESVALAEVREQVVPVVREALTDTVLQELKVLTQLLPEALQTLQGNLRDEDPKIREHAADTILRYTVGHSGIAPQAAEAKAQSINLNFGLPMQGSDAAPEGGSVLGTAEDTTPELRECNDCGAHKLPDEFMGASPRCQACHRAMLDDINTKMPGMLPSGYGS